MLDKSKAPLALMEHVLMILFFAAAMSVALRAFAWCGTQSKRLEREQVMLGAAMTACEAVRTGDAGLLGMDGMIAGDFEAEIDGVSISVRYADEGDLMWIATVGAELGGDAMSFQVAGQKGR